ncbi:MAG TPA: hypothetical protein VLL28_11380 [Hyphomicrobiaceae bacterium]|nr:hypothetical protein [Hyphomicrobiaceae bacterium]
MDASAFDKSKLHSRHGIEGPSRAPWRAHEALGLREEHILGPVASVRSRWNEVVAGTIAPMRQAQVAKRDVGAADRAPRQSSNRVDATRRPGGKEVARDVCDIRRALGEGGDRNAAGLPVSDGTSAPTRENVKPNRDQWVVDPVAHPISAMGNAVGLQGSRAPDSAIGKVAGMTRLQFRIRERERDIIASEAKKGTLDLDVGEAGLGMRRKARKAPANPYESGTLRRWANQVGPVRAVAHAGSRAEVVGYADI